MTGKQRALALIFPILGGILPILVYWVEHGGLGTPTFADQQAMTRMQQIAQVLAGLYIKPAYMLISCALIIGLIGQNTPEIRALYWGLIAFLVGETFCAINFITYKHASIPSEYAHSFGMVLAFGLIAYAFVEIVERHIFHINAGRCAANSVCATCNRASPLDCSARRVGMLILLLAGILCLLPLTVSASPESYTTEVFGFAYSYARFDFYQWYETRALPSFALAAFLGAFLPLLGRKGAPIPSSTKLLASAGIGALGFSIFRTMVAALFARDLVWFEFWEEASEFMMVFSLAFLLWQFRHSLLQRTPVLEIAFRKPPSRTNQRSG